MSCIQWCETAEIGLKPQLFDTSSSRELTTNLPGPENRSRQVQMHFLVYISLRQVKFGLPSPKIQIAFYLLFIYRIFVVFANTNLFICFNLIKFPKWHTFFTLILSSIMTYLIYLTIFENFKFFKKNWSSYRFSPKTFLLKFQITFKLSQVFVFSQSFHKFQPFKISQVFFLKNFN